MMRVITFFACLIVIVSAGCNGSEQTQAKPNKIWDIYTDLSFENDESFLASMKTKHPAEQRLVTWLKENREQAYYDYMQLLKSQTYSDGKKLELTPNCYHVEGQKGLLTQKDVIQLYYDLKINPIPGSSPHGAVTNFIESLANGSAGQAKQATQGKFSENFSDLERQNDYWNKISQGNLYARIIIKKVDMPKDLKSASVFLEILFFTQQNHPGQAIRLVRMERTVEISLDKDGTWLIQNQH